MASAIHAQGLDANDVAEDYAACQALATAPMSGFNHLSPVDFEMFAPPNLFPY